MRTKRGGVPVLRSLPSTVLSFALFLTSPGQAAYAAASEILRPKAPAAEGAPAQSPLGTLALPLSSGLDAASPADLAPAGGISVEADKGLAPTAASQSSNPQSAVPASSELAPRTANPEKSAEAAPQADGDEGSSTIQRVSRELPRFSAGAGAKPEAESDFLRRVGSYKERAASAADETVAAGSAFGVGDTHKVENHLRTNAVIADAFKSGRASVAHGEEAAGVSSASDAEKALLAQSLAGLALETRSVPLEGLGTVALSQVFASLKRIVLVDPGEGRHPLALRHVSGSDFQVSHVGFGEAHDAPTIYVSRAFLSQVGAAALKAVLINDLIEVGGRQLAKASAAAWTEELSRRVQDEAANYVGRQFPRAVYHVRALVSGLEADFEELGIGPEMVRREYLSDTPEEQQTNLNRLAALRAKGFAPAELTSALLRAQGSLDRVLAEEDPLRSNSSLASLKALRDSEPATFARLAKGLDFSRLFAGQPPLLRLASEPHSSVSGLALRAHLALKAGRDARGMLSGLRDDPNSMTRLWKAWDQPQAASTIPTLDQLPQVRTTLAGALEKVRAQALSEQAVLDKETTGVEGLIKKHPLAETWREMQTQLQQDAADRRAELRDMPPIRGRSPEAQELRQRKEKAREAIDKVNAQAEALKTKVELMQERAEPLALLSMAMREWFPGMRGLSVTGDFLWDKGGKGLDMLLILPGDSSPRKLRPEVLRKVSGLNGSAQVEVTGYVVGEKWLRGTFFDVDRNVLISRFSLLGLSLWGPNIAQFYSRLPERELWAAALSQLEAAESLLGGTSWEEGRLPLGLALSLATALGLKLDGAGLAEGAPELLELLDAEAEPAKGLDRAARRAALASRAAALRELLDRFRDQGRRQDVERRLQSVFDRLYRQDLPGQVGGVLLEAASARAEGLGLKPLYELTLKQARQWLKQTAESGKPVASAAESVAAILDRLKAKARYWDWLPETLAVGKYVRVGETAFGRPVEVMVEVSELEDRPELMGLVVEAAPDVSGAERYTLYLNGAVMRMEQHVQEAVLGSLLRQLALSMEGMPLDKARDKAMSELQELRVRDDRKDREVLEGAVAQFRAGVRVESLSEEPAPGAAAPSPRLDWTRRARQDEVLRLAQAVSDYLKAPQRNMGGNILLGYTTEAMLPLVRAMAEVFAGNGLEVTLVEGGVVPGAMHHAVREGPYRMGFLVSKETVLPFGHYQGSLPPDEMTEIVAAENAVRRVRRLGLDWASLRGKVGRRQDVQKAYLASLKERFDVRRITEASLRLVIDTEQSETGALLRALGLSDDTVDVGENLEAVQTRVRQAAGKGLGAVMGRDGSRIQLVDLDGQSIRPSDLSLIFTWYLVRHRGHKGKIFRAFTQTRLLDRLAARHGLTVEEVDPAVWGISEADSIVLSPWTPYNDLFSQALLAAEIVATTGKSLRETLESIRGELGAPLDYQKAKIAIPAAYSEKLGDRLSDAEFRGYVARKLALDPAQVRARQSHKGIQISLAGGGWLYMRWTGDGVELYAEDSDPARARSLVAAGESYVRGLLAELGPSRALKASLVFMSLVVGLGGALVLLPLIDPTFAMQTPIIGGIYQLVGRLVELGFGALEWLFPNMLRKILPSWNNPWVMVGSVLLFVEFFWYWGMRALSFVASVLRSRPKRELAPEIERLPDLGKSPRGENNDYFIVAPMKDGRLGVLKPGFARIWQWVQPLLFVYEAQTLIQGKRYDDSNVLFRASINARGWLFFKSLLLEPRIIFHTWWNLFSAVFPGFSRLLVSGLRAIAGAWGALRGKRPDWNPELGLPGHLSPAVGVPLPAALRGRYRTELALVKKVSDGDTIQLFDGSFWGSRWVRYKGMDASDNKKGDLYRLAKERNIQMVRGKKVLLLIPQIKQGEHMGDEYDVNGRVLAYVFAQDPSGKWVNMTRLLYKEGLATTDKGAPDPEVPYSFDVNEPMLRARSALSDQETKTAPVEANPIAAEPVLPDAQARQVLSASGAQVAADAQVLLAASFAGEQGQLLGERLGRGADIGPRGQLFAAGPGVRIGEDLKIAEGARLNVEAEAGRDSEPGELLIGNGVSVEGKFRILVPKDSHLRVLNGTALIGDRTITVPPGQSMSIRTLPDGSLSVQTEYRHPKAVWTKLWENFKRGTGLDKLLDWVRASRIDPAELSQWWKGTSRRGYEPVHMPPKLSQFKTVSRERSSHLDGKHETLVAEAVSAKKQQMLRSSREVPRKFLLRHGGQDAKVKQTLLVGLEEHYGILLERQGETIKRLFEEIEPKLRRWLSDKAGLNEREKQKFIKALKLGESEDIIRDSEEDAKTWEEVMELLPETTQKALQRILREVETLKTLKAKQAEELAFFMDRARQRLADLSGLILLGPRRLPEAVSVVLGGDYLFSKEPKSLELLVVRPGDSGPELMDSAFLRGVALPSIESLRIVAVGEDWLKPNLRDGMRNRLLSRFIVTGTTLWGRDVSTTRPENIGRRVPAANYLALADEYLEEAKAVLAAGGAAAEARAADLARLAHLVLLSVAPGLAERLPEGEASSVRALLQDVRRQQKAAEDWLRSEELYRAVGRGMSGVAAHEYADSGVGGVFLADVRPEDMGFKALYKISSNEAWNWIRRLVEASGPVDGAQGKLDALLERLKSRGLWWVWYPEKLEEGHFAVIGRDSRGRVVEARIRVRHAPQAPGTLAVIAESEEGRKISDVDRYEVFLNGVIFDMSPAAQEIALASVIRQLELALSGDTLREARDTAYKELALVERGGGKSWAKRLWEAAEDYARGLRVRDIGPALQLPWESSTWRGELGIGDSMRLAEGVGEYLKLDHSAGAGVLVGFSAEQGRPAAERVAQVLAAKGVRVRWIEEALSEPALASALASDPSALGIWVSPEETRVLGKEGKPLPVGRSNELGWMMMRARYARSLEVKAAREQGLIEGLRPPADAKGAVAKPEPPPSEPTAPRKPGWAVMGAFVFHSALVGVLAALFLGSMFYPAFVTSLPFVSVIFTLVRSMMMFKSVMVVDYAWVVGLVLMTVVTFLRYWRYGKIMYGMSKGSGRYRGLLPELEGLPRIHSAARRSQNWQPVEALPDGRVAIREESFARLSPFLQTLIYTHAAAKVRFAQHPISRFLTNISNKLVIGRFKIAKVTFFVVTEPFVILLEWAMLWRMFLNRLLGRPTAPLFRVTPESPQGLPILPPEVEENFSAEWVTITSIVNESTVQLEDNRTIRVIGAGKPGKGISLVTTDARGMLLQGQEVLLMVPNAQNEGSRRIAGHLYVAGPQGPSGGKVLTRAIYALAAGERNGPRLPASAEVDAEKLPLFLELEDASRQSRELEMPPQRWEKYFSVSALALLAGTGFFAFAKLLGAGLSPLAHGLAFVALPIFLIPALYGLVRLWRGLRRGFMLKHKFMASLLILTMSLGTIFPMRGSNWQNGPAGRGLSSAALQFLESTRLLPRPGELGFDPDEASAAQEPWRVTLPADNPLVVQSRELLGPSAAASDALATGLPPELATKYRGVWAYVSRIIDGDTIVLSNGWHVRYLSFNAPETFHPGFNAKEGAEPGGEEATVRNSELCNHKRVLLLVPRDRWTDHYRRLLAYIYAPDAQGKLVNVNVTLLEEGHGNARYGLPEDILRKSQGGKYYTIDPATLPPASPQDSAVAAEGPAPHKLRLNPTETRTYVQEVVQVDRWIDGQSFELPDGRIVKLSEIDIAADKSANALDYAQGLVKPGQEVILLHAKSYQSLTEPWRKDSSGRLVDYVYFAPAGGGDYQNLNSLVFKQGLSTTQQGTPDPALPDTAALEKDNFNYEQVAWEAASAPLRALQLSNPNLAVAYTERVMRLDRDAAKPFEADASLLALYAGQMMISPADQERLLGTLVAARSSAEYDRWVTDELAPVLRTSLAAQKIPLPAGNESWDKASWQDALIYAAAGKLGAAPDAIYFPSAEQARLMREFLDAQKVPQDRPPAFAEGLVFAKLSLRFPIGMRMLIPETSVAQTRGAFWAPVEMSELNRRALFHSTNVSPLLMEMSYAYPETSWLLLSDSRQYVALTAALAREAMVTPGLMPTTFRDLAKVVAPDRVDKMRVLMEGGQASSAIKELSPVELFTLGRFLADEPELNRYMLTSLKGLRALGGRLSVEGTNPKDFAKELDALLAMPGGGSVSAAPMPPYDAALTQNEWMLQRRLFAEIVVQTLISMDKEKVPERLLPLLLPRAVEAVQKGAGRVGFADDWTNLLKSIHKITPGQVRSWVYELMPQGLSSGQELNVGLSQRQISSLLTQDIGSRGSASSFDERKVVGTLGFPVSWDNDLKTYIHGSFRVDEGNESVYQTWQKGDVIKIAVGKKTSRRSLYNTQITAIERKKISDMTLDDLRSEFSPTRFWNPLQDDEALRQELIKELIAKLRSYYPNVNENSSGYMIEFNSYPEVREQNQK